MHSKPPKEQHLSCFETNQHHHDHAADHPKLYMILLNPRSSAPNHSRRLCGAQLNPPCRAPRGPSDIGVPPDVGPCCDVHPDLVSAELTKEAEQQNSS